MATDDVKYFKSKEIGKGLPYAYTSSQNLIQSPDIFTPSLRDFHVIFWIRKGKGTYVVDFKEYRFRPNTLILLSKDQLHYFQTFEHKNTEIDSLVFSPEFLYRNDSDLQHLFNFQSGTHNPGHQILKIPNMIHDRLEMMARELRTVYNNRESAYKSKSFYHWLCLFLIQCEMLQEVGDVSPEKNTIDIVAFNDLLELNFRKEYKVEFYANKLNI